MRTLRRLRSMRIPQHAFLEAMPHGMLRCAGGGCGGSGGNTASAQGEREHAAQATDGEYCEACEPRRPWTGEAMSAAKACGWQRFGVRSGRSEGFRGASRRGCRLLKLNGHRSLADEGVSGVMAAAVRGGIGCGAAGRPSQRCYDIKFQVVSVNLLTWAGLAMAVFPS